jgi:hypothetical protein
MCFDSRNPASSAATQSIRGWTRFVLILFAASACTAWRPHAVETSTPQTNGLQGHFRVTVRDGSRVGIKDVLISGDSISGLRDTRQDTGTNWASGERVAVPRSQVISLERQSFSARKTTYAVIASAAGAYVALVVFVIVGMSQGGIGY